MVRRLLRMRVQNVVPAWILAVMVLAVALAAPVQAAVIPSPAVQPSRQPYNIPLVIYTSTPFDTTGRAATVAADRTPGIPLVIYTSTSFDTTGRAVVSQPEQVSGSPVVTYIPTMTFALYPHTAGRAALSPDRVPDSPLVIYTSTRCDTAGPAASALAGQVASAAPMVATTGDGCATRADLAGVAAKPSRIVSGKWLLPVGH